MDCMNCGERLPDPDLWDAITGTQGCRECEARRDLSDSERAEAAWAIEQKLKVLEDTIQP